MLKYLIVFCIRYLGHEKEVYNNFKKAISKLKNFEVYKRKNIPQRWHYKNNRRVVDLLLVAKLHYVFENQSKLKGIQFFKINE